MERRQTALRETMQRIKGDMTNPLHRKSVCEKCPAAVAVPRGATTDTPLNSNTAGLFYQGLSQFF